jgi:hypothetical protein
LGLLCRKSATAVVEHQGTCDPVQRAEEGLPAPVGGRPKGWRGNQPAFLRLPRAHAHADSEGAGRTVAGPVVAHGLERRAPAVRRGRLHFADRTDDCDLVPDANLPNSPDLGEVEVAAGVALQEVLDGADPEAGRGENLLPFGPTP